MRELIELKQDGVDPATRSPSRTCLIPEPTAWTPDRIQSPRNRIAVSQAVFARLVGVSTILAQGWEQGKRTPAPVAARLLDTIDRDPAAWLAATGAELPATRSDAKRSGARASPRTVRVATKAKRLRSTLSDTGPTASVAHFAAGADLAAHRSSKR